MALHDGDGDTSLREPVGPASLLFEQPVACSSGLGPVSALLPELHRFSPTIRWDAIVSRRKPGGVRATSSRNQSKYEQEFLTSAAYLLLERPEKPEHGRNEQFY